MAVFEYKGLDHRGKAVKGLKEADSAKAAKVALRRDNIMVTEIKLSGGDEEEGGKKKGLLSKEVDFSGLQRISVDDIGLATRQLATLLDAGVPMVESLTALIDQVENRAFKRVLSQVKTDVNEGSSLHKALSQHKCFTHIYVNLVRAGEESGTLDVVLERLADFTEGQSQLRSQITGALAYPAIMILVGIGIVGVLFTVVVPRITRIFEHAKAQLPLMTRILIFLSSAARDYWWAGFLVLGGSVFFFRKWVSTEKGRALWDRFTLALPIFGPLLRMIAVARFSRTLGTLLQAGVPLLTSLDICREVVANKRIADAVEDTRTAIREGEEIAPPLKRSGQFPPMVTHMIAIGERTGQLENMLNRVAISYEGRIDVRVKALTSLMEPVIILFMGGAVGFIVFSILKPILEMNTLIK